MSLPGPTPALAAAPPTACLNCGEPLAARSPRSPARFSFCPACGQETNVLPPTLREFAQQFGGAYISTEGALWRTLKLLLMKPGELTVQYLAGRRKHYVLPLRLYLTISLLALLALRIGAGLSLEQEGAIQFDLKDSTYTAIALGSEHNVGMRDGKFFCVGMPPWLCQQLQRRMDVDAAVLKREIAEIGQRFVGNIGIGMFVMLPAFALTLKVVYWNRRLRYTEHLVFALHLHAFWFLALAATVAGLPWVSGLAAASIPINAYLAMRRVYGGRWWPRALRCGLIAFVYFVLLSFVLVGVFLGTAIA